MSIYEFYVTYILTRKAIFLSTSLYPLRTTINGNILRLDYIVSIGSLPIEISHDQPITAFSRLGVKIALISDPIHITASVLTGVISIPVPEPDELPF